MAVLKAENVCKYFGGLKAVENVSMEVQKGEVYGIIGPNGAGKTTFFNTCSGVYHPTSGKVIFHNEDISALKPEEIARRGMARTFQNIKLFRYLSVADNVKVGFHIHTKTNIWDAILRTKRYHEDERLVEEGTERILEQVGLSAYRDARAGTLSYGMQRRVEIARALALNPSLLLLDEPAAGMNPTETQSLSDFIRELKGQGYTIVVIEHDMKFIMNLCDRILVLNFGQKICEGPPEEVKNNKDVQEAYFGKGLLVADMTGEEAHSGVTG